MAKGIEKLIDTLAETECPSNFGLKDVKRKDGQTFVQCAYGDLSHKSTCIECFKQAIELEYESEEE